MVVAVIWVIITARVRTYQARHLAVHVLLISAVGATAVHAMEHGFRTTLIENATRGVTLEDINSMREKLKRQGAAIVNSNHVRIVIRAVDVYD